MKKKLWIPIILCVLLLTIIIVVLLTRPDNSKTFTATIITINSKSALVKPVESSEEIKSSDQITFSVEHLPNIEAKTGSVVELTYNGNIEESYPAKIHVTKWEIAKDLRSISYKEQWIDKDAAKKIEDVNEYSPMDLIITEIYSDCFFARAVVPFPIQYKINGKLSDEWCVEDQVLVSFDNILYDEEQYKLECDLKTIKESTLEHNPNTYYKPVIYLYPEKETNVSVKLSLDGKFTCTYPLYNKQNGWSVTASPDGTLTDKNGQTYNYLYWEGETNTKWDFSKGFCVKGSDTAAFLEKALSNLGLTRREANEFIVYWLPQMQDNPYNIISFQTDNYTNSAKLNITPKPDTTIRVFMAYKPSDSFVNMQPQKLLSPERKGFTVVEWGGDVIRF